MPTIMRSTSLARSLTVVAASLICLEATAQITESDWNDSLTGNQLWQIDGNWSTPAFPDDPGRADPSEEVISPVIGANLSVGLGADLNLDVGATDVTVASLRLGGTAGPVTTTISSTGGRLVFENYELNNNLDPENVIPSFNSSQALLVSGGVPGSTNVISAPILINNERVEIKSLDDFVTTNDLTITGSITFGAGTSQLNLATSDAELHINGDVVVTNVNTEDGVADGGINRSGPGTVRINGIISGDGRLELGGGDDTTTVLSGANTISGTVVAWGPIVLDNDLAFGTAVIRRGGVMSSTDDNRTINNEWAFSDYVTIAGEHSLDWAGGLTQKNSRGIVNQLPAGKTFTVSGQIGADGDPPEGTKRELYFDGSGETIVSGEMKNRIDELENEPQSFGFRGTGTVRITGVNNSYSEASYIEGANVHFASNDSLPIAEIRSIAGSVGVDTGTLYVAGDPNTVNSAFIAKLNNRSQRPLTPAGDVVWFFDYDHGGLMLTAAEADADFDFTSGDLSPVSDMSLAGGANGITYTGSVTPADSTYRFGGGTGEITLPGTNQLTGANKLVATNGLDSGTLRGLGGVRITGTNDYTGATLIEGNTLSSRSAGFQSGSYAGTTLTVLDLADGGQTSGIGASSSDASNLIVQGSTLRYEGNGDATDRLFTIGTRGATIDSSGSGPLIFSSTGALTIDTAEDRSGVVSGPAFGFQTGVTQASSSVAYNIGDTSDLVPGMQISGSFLTESGSDDDEVITIVKIQSPTRVQFSDPVGPFVNFAAAASTLSFVDVERTFTLAGDNTGDNVLNPTISDSATGVVNLAKSGSGKWIVNGINTYSGDTIVEDGVLSITNSYLSDTGNVEVGGGGLFDLDFAGTDTIGALYLDGIPQLTLGTFGGIGSGADFESSHFSGSGLLGTTAIPNTQLAGDFNNDGVVNAADYTVWRDNEGAAEGTLVNAPGTPGVIGSDHYDLWVSNYGATIFGAASSAASAAVPEPGALALFLAAIATSLTNRWRHPTA
ncbi:Autotransporter-associated beta strand repeat protein [Botrimarina colliarenosi]|uniref:Autotransporter-associated beta strand repeat protein n=1 Tax=Botrimarina colliarenosi TaxID=2528001 RepID=A0A5C6A6Z1_9BACT|nr:autotransporter-associated beta strand repeat-containing protein [Botrimarina colliarenosi]TWT94841.1 Autotransporter-associated beta strand repeat protein [Botrimarina colliarenosi]